MVFPDVQEKRGKRRRHTSEITKTMLLAGAYVKLVERYASYIQVRITPFSVSFL